MNSNRQVFELFELASDSDSATRAALFADPKYSESAIKQVQRLLAAEIQDTRLFNANIVADVLAMEPTFFDQPEDQQNDSREKGPLEPGQTIGDFQVLRLLGSGGMSFVYLAMQNEPVRREVALKVIRPRLVNDYSIKRFERETAALAKLSHPHIATLYGAGSMEVKSKTGVIQQPRLMYANLEYVPGQHIDRFCTEQQLSRSQILRLAIQACQGLSHAHQQDLIHRDIKPSNLLVFEQENTRLKIIDFGIVKIADADPEQPNRTMTGHLLGSPRYMSPEQYVGGKLDSRTDQFSLAIVIFELLTETPFFESLSRAAASPDSSNPWSDRLDRIDTSHPANDLSRVNCLRLKLVLAKALSIDSAKRYPNCDALKNDLKAILENETISVPFPGKIDRIKSTIGKRRKIIASIAAVFALILFSLVGFWGFKNLFENQSLKENANLTSRDIEASNQLILELCAEGEFEKHRFRFGDELLPMYERQKAEIDLRGGARSSKDHSVYLILAILYCNRDDFWKADTAIEMAKLDASVSAKGNSISKSIYDHFEMLTIEKLSQQNLSKRKKLDLQIILCKCRWETEQTLDINTLETTIAELEISKPKSLLELTGKNLLADFLATDPVIKDKSSQVYIRRQQLLRTTYQKFKFHHQLIATERGYHEFGQLLLALYEDQPNLYRPQWQDFQSKRPVDFAQASTTNVNEENP